MVNELFDSIAETLFPTAEIVDLRGWGESLILPDILSRIERVASYGAKLRIVTNLSFRRPDVLDALISAGALVAVSLDSADSATLSRIRRGANLDLITSNLEYLVRGFGHAQNVSILVAVQRPALGTLPNLVEHVASCGINEIKLFSVDVDGPSELELTGHDREIDAALSAMRLSAERLGVSLIAGTQMGSLPDNGPNFPACIHPWTYVYITYDGDVSFCDLLIGPGNSQYVLGNLRDAEFHQIWNGSAWRRIRSEHIGARRASAPHFQHCARCYKKKYVDLEHIFEPRYNHEVVQLAPAAPSRGVRAGGN
jgi:radical SAM protein with 4Fe4S-binding SPASM domain